MLVEERGHAVILRERLGEQQQVVGLRVESFGFDVGDQLGVVGTGVGRQPSGGFERVAHGFGGGLDAV